MNSTVISVYVIGNHAFLPLERKSSLSALLFLSDPVIQCALESDSLSDALTRRFAVGNPVEVDPSKEERAKQAKRALRVMGVSSWKTLYATAGYYAVIFEENIVRILPTRVDKTGGFSPEKDREQRLVGTISMDTIAQWIIKDTTIRQRTIHQ